jgi:hypothetical protein
VGYLRKYKRTIGYAILTTIIHGIIHRTFPVLIVAIVAIVAYDLVKHYESAMEAEERSVNRYVKEKDYILDIIGWMLGVMLGLWTYRSSFCIIFTITMILVVIIKIRFTRLGDA